MVHVLHVIGRMGAGGAESLLMNIYRTIDRTKVQFDFVVHTKEKQFYDDEIGKLGGRIFHTDRFNIINYHRYRKWWDTFFEEHKEYDVVHGHINSSASIYLSCAKKHGIYTVVHSHNTKSVEKTARAFAFKIFSYPIRYLADYYFACSRQAGIDRFGARVVNSTRFKVLMNGIDADRFVYSKERRDKVRMEFNINESTLVIGHTGRFSEQKNHRFLIEVFAKIHEKNPDSQLWLIGAGDLQEEIKKVVQEKNIQNSVFFWGITNRVADYLQGMDVFVFPSIYEGLGIALIEAQAAGLPCVVSETIQEEADIGAGLIDRVSLSDGYDRWIETILQAAKQERKNTLSFVKKAGYDIGDTARWIETFYCKNQKT